MHCCLIMDKYLILDLILKVRKLSWDSTGRSIQIDKMAKFIGNTDLKTDAFFQIFII